MCVCVCACVLHVSGVGDSAKVYGFEGARGIRIGFVGAFRARLVLKIMQASALVSNGPVT